MRANTVVMVDRKFNFGESESGHTLLEWFNSRYIALNARCLGQRITLRGSSLSLRMLNLFESIHQAHLIRLGDPAVLKTVRIVTTCQ